MIKGGKSDSDKDNLQKQNARRISIKEGAFSSVASGLGDSYISAFMVALTNNPIPISLLSSVPGLASPLAQIAGSKMMESQSRKKIVVRFVLLQALLWIPLSIIGLMFWQNTLRVQAPYLLIIAYTIFAIAGGLAGPAWFSWIGDLVPEKHRGKYFSRRNRIAGFVSLVAFLIGAFILDYFKTKGFVTLGFSLLFALASVFRLIAFTEFRKQYDPPFKLNKKYYFSFWQYINRYGNFLKFSVFQATFYFALMIAGPFFTAHMLNNLHFSYITYTTVSISSTLFYLLFLPRAGRFSDKYGNTKMLYFSSLIFSIYPFLWLFIENPIILVLIPQLLIGIASAGFAISTTNYIYETVTPQRRGICVAYMNVLVGIGVFLGSILGGFIVKSWHPSFMKPILFAFLLSAILRTVVSLIFIPQVKEKEVYHKLPPLSLHPSFLFKIITGESRALKENIQQSLLTLIPSYLHERGGKKR